MPKLFFARPKKNGGTDGAKASKPSKAPKAGAGGPWILREIFTGKRRHEVQGIAWWAGSLLLIAAFWPHAVGHNALGPMGEILFRLGFALIGVLIYCAPLLTILYGLQVFRGATVEHFSYKALGLGLAALACLMILELLHPQALDFPLVPSFYDGPGWRRFWEGLPRGWRLWGDYDMPVGGLPARGVTEFVVAIFSVVGTYIVCGTVLVISLYLLEIETRFLETARRFLGGFRELGDKTKTLPLGYAEPAKPKPVKPAVKAAENPSAAEKPKIRISVPPAPAPETEDAPARVPGKSAFPGAKGKSAPGSETEAGEYTPAAPDTQEYRLPQLALLNESRTNSALAASYFETMSQTLENALAQFGVSAKVVEVCPGPVVTRYELQPAPGVKVNRILSLADDIALAMKAEHVRIEAPIPGKGAVGIEIPNSEKQIVALRELLADPEFRNGESVLKFAVGKDIGGAHVFARLETMPHLLIAGATGSGKSACINSILCSLLYQATPREARFLMIDPKRVELTPYNGIPHLKAPVITDSGQAAMALKLMVKEMEDRYTRFAQAGVRDIKSYNEMMRNAFPPAEPAPEPEEETSLEAALKTAAGEPAPAKAPAPPAPMPYIVVVIDELADLMMVAANEVENAITRLAQMARGVGIHLVLATQRPSVDVITGVIKANFPSRIAFQVSSKVDSRTILDANGADALLGRGDMLYAPASATKPLRVQGVFVTGPEVDRVTSFWKQQGKPVFDPAFANGKLKTGAGGENAEGEEDELYSDAVSWVVRAKQASTSLLQRRLKIGYSRAARLLDLMEEKGVVGPPEGSKPRKVLVDTDALGYGSGEATGED